MKNTTKVKKPWYKRAWVWVVVVLVLFFGMISEDEETIPAIETTASTTSERIKTEDISSTSTKTEEVVEPDVEPIIESAIELETDLATKLETDTVSDQDITHTIEESEPINETENDNGRDYVINTNSSKFHYSFCSSVNTMNDSNRWDYHGTYDELISMGYEPCGRCKP